MLYVISGEHSFRFQPSQITPDGTTFMNMEEHFRLPYWLSPLLTRTMISKFEEFNRDLKARVESLKLGG